MAVVEGTDYAVARKTTWWFSTGPGPATGVLTRAALYLFPHRAIGGRGTTTIRTTYTIGGKPPLMAIQSLLVDPQTTPQSLDGQLGEWCAQVEGPIREDLSLVKRVRIFRGWLRRSVVFSEKESGYDLRPKSVRPTKQELPAFVAMLRDRPGVELK